jgi:hypothetical protein
VIVTFNLLLSDVHSDGEFPENDQSTGGSADGNDGHLLEVSREEPENNL